MKNTIKHERACRGLPEPHIERLPAAEKGDLYQIVIRCGCRLICERGPVFSHLDDAMAALKSEG